MSDAPACRDEDPELFFPERQRGFMSGAYRRQYVEAASVCAECPIRLRCLEDNLDVPYGVWGGLDPHDRGVLLKAQGRVTAKDRPQFRNMSPFPNEHQVLAQRARHAAVASGDVRRMSNARNSEARNARRREARALGRSA